MRTNGVCGTDSAMGQFEGVKPPVPFTIEVDLRKIHIGDTMVMRTNSFRNPQI